jgi:tRNA modification GTPase
MTLFAASADTIFALATPRAMAAIAVLRISGPATDAVLVSLGAPLPPFRMASLRRIKDPTSGAFIDEGLVTRFAANASYTGELSAEISFHGGLAVIDAMEQALEATAARLAKPGEFTYRALLNGNLDLSKAESVREIIHAEDQTARKQALRVLDGEVGRQTAVWREALISAAALFETGVDFVEEALGEELANSGVEKLAEIKKDMEKHVSSAQYGSTNDSNISIAILGPPNAGKSSLLNSISQRDTAIVTSIEGTTRDAIAERISLNGRSLTVIDTAGLRETSESIEREGVVRARRWANKADIRILAISSDTWVKLTQTEQQDLFALLEDSDAVFWTKADMNSAIPQFVRDCWKGHIYSVSTLDDSARSVFAAFAETILGNRAANSSPLASAPRRSKIVFQAKEILQAAIDFARLGATELAIAKIYQAEQQLALLVEAFDYDDVLDEVFGRFCIGK